MTQPLSRDRSSSGRPGQPFKDWQQAVAELKAAEARGDDHREILRLCEEVIRTRNELTLDRIRAGWKAPEIILRHLDADDRLLYERDDAALSDGDGAISLDHRIEMPSE